MKNKTLIVLLFIKKFGPLLGLYYSFLILIKKTLPILFKNIPTPIFLRPNTSDFSVFKQIFLEDEYNITYSHAPKNIIDAGANIGLFSVYIKNQFPNTQIVCIEPDRYNFDVLKKNLQHYDNVYFENTGIWSHSCKLRIIPQQKGGEWAIMVREDAQHGTLEALSIGDIKQKYQFNLIDILKIDIESSEKFVFENDYEAWLPFTKMIIIELHDWQTKGCSQSFFNAIQHCLKDYSLSIKGENIIIYNNELI